MNSSDWSAGDRAICIRQFNGISAVDNRPIPEPNRLPVKGVTYFVSAVGELQGDVFLFLQGFGDADGFASEKFHRIVPSGDRIR